MSFIETIAVAAIGAAAGAVAVYINKNKAAKVFLKYGPVVKKAYDIIDPILDQNLRNWHGSQVERAFELSIQAAADGQLSADEIRTISFYMAQAWLPQKAADKARQLEQLSRTTPELRMAAKIIARVNGAGN